MNSGNFQGAIKLNVMFSKEKSKTKIKTDKTSLNSPPKTII